MYPKRNPSAWWNPAEDIGPMMRIVTVIALGLGLSVSGFAQGVCVRCGRVHQPQPPTQVQVNVQLPGQHVAQARANYLAQGGRRLYRRVGGHPSQRDPVPHFTQVGSFEGTGMTGRRFAPRNIVPTCRPSGRSGAAPDTSRPLVGDAVATGPDGTYRVRIWGRSTGGSQPAYGSRFRLFRR